MSKPWKYFDKHQTTKPLTPEQQLQVETRIQQMLQSADLQVRNDYSTPLNWGEGN